MAMFNFKRQQTSTRKDGFWASVWSAGAFAALTSFTFSMLAIVYLTRDAIESNDEMIVRACLASPLFLLATILCLGFMAKQAAKYFADGYHAANAANQPQLPMASHAETIDAIARLVTSQQKQAHEVYQAHQAQLGTPLLPAPTRKPPLMEALRGEECILLWGQKGSGKTTVLLHLIRERLLAGHEVLVFDPHAFPNKWLSAQVVGLGRKYEEIDKGLSGVVDEMTRRYEQIARGEVREGEHPYITIIVDEYRSIVANVSDVAKDKKSGILESKESVATLLTEARKTNIHIALISHSKSVKALGLKGEGDLREGFAIVHLIKDSTGNRWAEVSLNGDDAIEMTHPGPFQAFQGQAQYNTNTVPGKPVLSTASKELNITSMPVNTTSIPQKQELSIEQVIEKLREKGKSEEVITRYLAKKYPKLSANAIQQFVKLGRNKVMDIVRMVRNADDKQEKHTNGHQNGRLV